MSRTFRCNDYICNTMQLSRQHISFIKSYFKNKPVLRAWLFGSQARGEANDNSDVDILVELDYDKKIGWEFITMQQELEAALGQKVDLVSARGLSPFIGPWIEAEKQLIYDGFSKGQVTA